MTMRRLKATIKRVTPLFEGFLRLNRYEIEAEGEKQMNEARNSLTDESRASELRLKLIEKLEAIIRESVKPMERIEGIKILQVDGLMSGGNGGAGRDEGGGSLADSVVNSALRYRAQAPLIDSLLQEIGISGGELGKLTGVLREPKATDGGEGEKE
jgi:uncharacterized membrane protein YqiK